MNDIEQQVCQDILDRQQAGIKKYGTTVAENPLPLSEWLIHAYQESLDLPIYLKRAQAEALKLERMEAQLADLCCALEIIAGKQADPDKHATDAQIAERWLRRAGMWTGPTKNSYSVFGVDGGLIESLGSLSPLSGFGVDGSGNAASSRDGLTGLYAGVSFDAVKSAGMGR